MNNFASIFQQFRNPNQSHISELLQTPNLHINQLLDEDLIISEFRNNNPQLQAFMSYNSYKQLVDYITIVGPEKQKIRSYKYPISAAEILSCENHTMIDFFLPENPLIISEITYQEVEIEREEEIDSNSLHSESSHRSQPENQIQQLNTQILPTKPPLVGLKSINQELSDFKLTISNKTKQQQNYQSCSFQSPQKRQMTPDDFPQLIVRTRKIKVKETITNTIKKQVPPLIQHILSSFYSEINYTLAAYISKVLQSLFLKKPLKFYKCFFEYEKNKNPLYVECINHIESKSIGDFIIAILTYNSEDYLQQKEQLCWLMLSRLSIQTNISTISGIGYVLAEVISKFNMKDKNINNVSVKVREMIKKIFAMKFLKKLYILSFGQNKQSLLVGRTLLLTFIQNIPQPDKTNADSLIQFQRLIQDIVLNGLSTITQLNSNSNRFSLPKFKILQVISFIISNNILNTRQMLVFADNQLIHKLVRLFQLFPFNNFLHHQLVKLFKSILEGGNNANDEDIVKPIYQNILSQNCLIGFIYHGIIENPQDKGYRGQILVLIKFIQNLKSQTIKSFLNCSNKWILALQKYDQENGNLNKATLGGFNVRKTYNCQIMFQKNQILKHYKSFLNENQQLSEEDFQFVDQQSSFQEADPHQMIDQKENNFIQNTAKNKGLQQRTENQQNITQNEFNNEQQLIKNNSTLLLKQFVENNKQSC